MERTTGSALKDCVRFDLTQWPAVDVSRLLAELHETTLDAYPSLAGRSRDDVHCLLQGQGGLFMASDMADLLDLRPGMRVLDLACGHGTTSIYLASRFGADVVAADELESPALKERAEKAGVGGLVTAEICDARRLPFERHSFDAVFCMNSLFYFGTDDLYPPYLLEFIKPGGELVVGGPCYRDELADDTPEEFLLEFPACLAVHSPGWWKRHFERSRLCEVTHAALHPRGVEFWEDRVKYLLTKQPLQEMPPWRLSMIRDILRMLNRDSDGFVSHFMMHLRVRPTDAAS